MGIQSGKIAVIFDNDPRLAAVWKGTPSELKNLGQEDDGSYGGAGGSQDTPPNGNDDITEPNRPQLSDIVLKGFELYEDASGMQRVKAKFRVYNSSEEQIDGFLYAVTISDSQGGRA